MQIIQSVYIVVRFRKVGFFFWSIGMPEKMLIHVPLEFHGNATGIPMAVLLEMA